MKTAAVTGSTKGIGKAIGVKLLQNGYFVYFNYAQDKKGAVDLENELRQFQGRFQILQNNFATEESIDAFAHEITCKSNSGTIDALVLNAGITDRTAWEELDIAQWNHVLYVNLTVPAFLIQKIGKAMTEGGSILCIGSVMGKYAHAVSVPYGVSKAALHFLAKSLVKEYAGRKITINAICTGFTETDWQKQKAEEQRSRIKNKIQMQRFAEPEEIADLAFLLLTNRYMTGSVVEIDGGYCCR